jgi:hypothetical protein
MDGMGSIRVEDPETYEIAAVCFAYCDRSRETAVYHRAEPDARDEQLLLDHVVEELSALNGATLVTRGHGRFPLEMLYHRLTQASGGNIVETGAARVLEGCFHATTERIPIRLESDTIVEAAHQLGIEFDPVLLSDYNIEVDRTDWRDEVDSMPLSDVSDPRMTDDDYVTLVEQHLGPEDGSVDSAQLAHCVKAYASADTGLICELVTRGTMDQVGCLQLSERLLKR